MRLLRVLIFGLAVCAVLSGCSTTEKSRALASDVKENLGRYREDRDKAIESLNASYRASYLSLMSQYRLVTADSLALGRRAEARSAADDMLLDWQKRSTLTAITGTLEAARTRELKAIEVRANAVEDARKRYTDSYAALDLELDKLKTAQAKVADLTEKDDVRSKTIEVLSRLAKAYQEAQKPQVPKGK